MGRGSLERTWLGQSTYVFSQLRGVGTRVWVVGPAGEEKTAHVCGRVGHLRNQPFREMPPNLGGEGLFRHSTSYYTGINKSRHSKADISKESNKQTDRLINKQTDKQADKQRDIQTGRQKANKPVQGYVQARASVRPVSHTTQYPKRIHR